MADSGSRQYQKLPPGWDCKYDQTTGNCYYINYITKAMQLEDPRSRYRPLQNERCSNESIAMHSFHGPGGSPYHVYPSNNMPAIRAFQTPSSSLLHMSTSPLLTSSRTQLINEKSSPLPAPKTQYAQVPRTVSMSRRSTIQETTFSNQIDTDAVVNKIQNMFPTASENHIRLLLKKYYNREAVVISALQVEKHPVTMPGPFVTPPAQRHLFHSNSAIHMTPPARRFDTASHLRGLEYATYSRTVSPVPPGRIGSVMSINSSGHGFMGHIGVPSYQASPRFGDQIRSSPKPHSSPKMKLRYMKNIFPKADETLLLDVLANADNNVQKSSEKLISLGYVRKDFAPPPKIMNRPQHDFVDYTGHASEDCIKIIPLRPKEYTEDEKEAIKHHIKEKYPQIADRILLMALESVNYAEDRAIQILQIVKNEEEEHIQKTSQQNFPASLECKHEDIDGVKNRDGHLTRHSHRDHTDVITEKLCKDFKSLMGRIQTTGPNASLAKGANEGLLLADYVTWNGANPDFCQGQRSLAKGSNSSLLSEHTYKAYRHNNDLCKGNQTNLAKGSIYAQKNTSSANKSIDIKCN